MPEDNFRPTQRTHRAKCWTQCAVRSVTAGSLRWIFTDLFLRYQTHPKKSTTLPKSHWRGGSFTNNASTQHVLWQEAWTTRAFNCWLHCFLGVHDHVSEPLDNQLVLLAFEFNIGMFDGGTVPHATLGKVHRLLGDLKAWMSPLSGSIWNSIHQVFHRKKPIILSCHSNSQNEIQEGGGMRIELKFTSSAQDIKSALVTLNGTHGVQFFRYTWRFFPSKLITIINNIR